jgi:hypothetical protein
MEDSVIRQMDDVDKLINEHLQEEESLISKNLKSGKNSKS